MRKKGEEIDVELIPAKSLTCRYACYLSTIRSNTPTTNNGTDSPAAINQNPLNILLKSKFIKAPPDITSKNKRIFF